MLEQQNKQKHVYYYFEVKQIYFLQVKLDKNW